MTIRKSVAALSSLSVYLCHRFILLLRAGSAARANIDAAGDLS
jgi:hypothetical protein